MQQAPKELWHQASYEADDIRAIQALAEGTASPAQQIRALDWIIHQASQTYDDPFRPNQPDVVNYVLGRASVGRQIVKLMKLKADKFNR